MAEEITVSLSVSRKVNLGNYESADVFLSVSGLPLSATEADVNEALKVGELAFEIVKAKAIESANNLREEGRFGGGKGTMGAETPSGRKVGIR